MSELPQGWASARLNDVCELINGRAYKQAELLESGRYPVLRVGNFFSNRSWYYSDLELPDDKYCDRGDLLYAWSASFGPRIWDGEKSIFHYHIWNTRLNDLAIDKLFLYHWFEWDKENIQADHGTGSTMIHVTKGDMEARALELPPLPEQRRIVAKIDSLTGKSSRARDRLDHIPRLVEKYKQAVLAAAFSGRFKATSAKNRSVSEALDSLRIAHRLQKTASEAAAEELFDLPAHWCWATAETVVEPGAEIVYGIVQPGPKLASGVPYVRGTDIEDGRIKLDQLLFTSAEIAARYERASLRGGDILLGIIRATKVAIVPDELTGGNITQGTARFRPSGIIRTSFLARWLKSRTAQDWLHSKYRGIDMPGLNLRDVRQLPVPVPPIEDQQFIETRIDQAFDWIDRLASEATSARRLIDRLDQAVLAKAFRGELVPQDPADEPASVLLDRIRAERGAAPKPGCGRKAKVV